MDEKKCCTVVNHYYGCYDNSGNGSSGGNNSTPVGTVISYMGTSAPEHYLICDGTIYNIDEYKDFSQFIKDQFGSYNYFGGDGAATFAVPDLRNEFLRGYHGNNTEKKSGEIGVHQEATAIPFNQLHYASSSDNWIGGYANGDTYPTNIDSSTDDSVGFVYSRGTFINTSGYVNQPTKLTLRPTNIAVLYCIKYE